MRMYLVPWPHIVAALLGLAMLTLLPAAAQQAAKPYRVTITEGKDEDTEHFLPLDPALRSRHEYAGDMALTIVGEGKELIRLGSIRTLCMVDGVVRNPKTINRLLPLTDGPDQQKRFGGRTFTVFGDIRVNLTVEVVAGNPFRTKPGAAVQRRLDTVRVHYAILNNGDVAHQVGCRLFFEPQFQGTFAAPTGNLLDGEILRDRQVPRFLEILEQSDGQDAGVKGIVTFRTGNQSSNKVEAPGKVVLTRRGLKGDKGDWDVPLERANGQSACVCYWEPKYLWPQDKRELALAVGKGVACRLGDESQVSIEFGGSFEPQQIFVIRAYVEDPLDGQHLTLFLPPGIERVAGKETQSVPPVGETGPSVVVWRCRLLDVGTYPIRIRSSTGVTQTRIITVAPPE